MQRDNRKKLAYYAKILISISLVFLIYGLIFNLKNDRRLINPVDDVVEVKEEENTISITTVDGSEVVPGNTITNTKDKTKEENNNSNNGNNTPPANNNPSGNVNNNPPINNNNNYNNNNTNYNQNTNNSVHIPTIDDANNALRTSIQNTYGITIKYGGETNGYTVGGISTQPVDNSTTINAALNRLKNVFAQYPNGFFTEIKKGGIPLTVILINNYADNSITGVTDSSYTYANISIALVHPFEESFYHESYHYIERYLFKRGANFNAWNTLNPPDFNYGTIVNYYSYANTFADTVPFVNNYAQTSDAEDRASTFEYMMAGSKASCLNYGNTVWQKANYIKNTIEAVFNTVNPNTTEYWERYI